MNSRRLIRTPRLRTRHRSGLNLHWKRPQCDYRNRPLSVRPMSALGHSQQMQSAPKSIDVRFAPKATVSHRTAKCRNGPEADMATVAICLAGSLRLIRGLDQGRACAIAKIVAGLPHLPTA
jgi:hypothetical protein